jgi:ATP-dependent Lon protease
VKPGAQPGTRDRAVCRKVARKVVVEGAETFEDHHPRQGHAVPRRATLPPIRLAEEQNEVGVATGLAWTEVGGEILVIEATLMPGRGRSRSPASSAT